MISFGQKLLGEYLAHLTGKQPVHDHRLEGFELDVWYPDFDLAFEFNGQHHFAPIYGRAAFTRQQVADRMKKGVCEANGIVLIPIRLGELHHPTIPEIICHRMVQAYGQSAGRRRHAEVCLNAHAPILNSYNRRFMTYRHNQQVTHPPVAGNSKEKRRLRRSFAH
jgi:hypothetical protein